MIMTEKPKHYSETAWKIYRTFIEDQIKRPSGHTITLTMGKEYAGGVPPESYATWIRESELFTEEILGTNGNDQDTIKFTKL